MDKIDKIKRWSNTFENKAVKIVAFYGSIMGLIALIPSIIAVCVWLYFFFVDLANISNYVKEFRASTEYHDFQIMQLTNIIKAETDPKQAFRVPLRMSNVPIGHEVGMLWYFTYVKVNGRFRIITYGAFPNKTDGNVGILDIHGKYMVAGTEPKPLSNK